MTTKFDPMTGEPILPKKEPKFDPMTGKPITSENKAQSQADRAALGGQGTSLPQKGKKRTSLIIAVIVLLITSGSVFAFTTLRSDKAKIFMAIEKTLQSTPELYKAINPKPLIDLISSENYTISLDGMVDDVRVSSALRAKSQGMQVGINAHFPYASLDVLGEIDQNRLRLGSSALFDKVVVYNFKGNNQGFLTKQLSDRELDQLNRFLSDVTNTKKYQATYDKINRAAQAEAKKLETDKLSKRAFFVDGQSQMCSGYRLWIKRDNVDRLINEIEYILKEDMDTLMFPLMLNSYYDDPAEAIEDLMDDLRNEFYYMKDTPIDIYLHKGMVAAITTEAYYGEMALAFEGGDSRMQNIRFGPSDARQGSAYIDTIELTCYNGGEEEFFALALLDEKSYTLLGQLRYNTKNGDIQLSDSEGYYDLQLNLKTGKDAFDLRLNQFTANYSYYYSPNVAGNLSIKKGSTFETLRGTEVDLGNANQYEFYDIAYEIEDLLYDFY